MTLSPLGCKVRPSKWLSDIDPVAVGILEDESTQTEVLVAQAFDDPHAVSLADIVKAIRVFHHQMGDIEGRSLVISLQGEMELGIVAFQDNETDGISVFEDFAETQDVNIKVECTLHITDGKRRGDSAEPGRVVFDILHDGLVHGREAVPRYCGRCRDPWPVPG